MPAGGKIKFIVNKYPIDLRYLSKKSFESNITTLIVDSALSLAIEIKDSDTNENFEDFFGIITYSNNQSAVDTYEIIFENLWYRSELESFKK